MGKKIKKEDAYIKYAIRIGIITVVCASLVVGYYFYLSHRSVSADEQKVSEQTELEKVISRDLAAKYPQTPREVIKFYNRILKLYYDSNTKDAEIEMLCDQAMMLFDSDLIQQNPRDVYVASVRSDISTFHARNKKMVTTDVCDTSDVVYKKMGGNDMAYVLAYYFVSEGSDYQQTYQKYALRKDKSGNYKILAFTLSDQNGD